MVTVFTSTTTVHTLQMKGRWESNINVWFPIMYSQKWNYAASLFSKQNPILIYLWEIYIFPESVCLFCCSQICGLILGIYKSLTNTWLLKLGLRPRNSQKRNTEMGFSLLCTNKYCTLLSFYLQRVLGTMLSWYTNKARYWLRYVFGKNEWWCYTVINAHWNHPEVTLLNLDADFFIVFYKICLSYSACTSACLQGWSQCM